MSLKYNCVAMFDNHAKVMIEIQHGNNLILVFNKTNFLDDGLKLFEVQVIRFLSNQGSDNFLEVKPPEEHIKEKIQ